MMTRNASLLASAGRLLALALLTTAPALAARSLEAGFSQPPPAARPLAWWHWMYGNVSKPGIQADLEAMAHAGLGGVQLFPEATLDVPAGAVRYHSAEWYDDLRYAVDTAARLGLTIDIMNCAGWSEAGGPWVSADHSMKDFVWSERTVTGPARIHATLPQPAARLDYYRDAVLLAVPADEPSGEPFTMATNASAATARLLDGDERTGIAPAQAPRDCHIDLVFAQPVTRSLVELTYAQTRKGGADFAGTIEASDDGVQFHPIRSYRLRGFGHDLEYALSIPFATTTARVFRISVGTIPSNMVLAELRLSRGSRLQNYQGAATRASVKVARSPWPDAAALPAIAPAQVIDLTGRLAADGTLDWNAPPGRWTLLRCGYTTTGHRNAPASPDGQGLEVDKMDPDAVQDHFEHSLGRVFAEEKAHVGRTLTGVFCDSWEAGHQGWTTRFEAAFREHRGYAMRRWIPVLTGRIIGSAAESEAFLADYRRTITDLVGDNFYGTLQRLCRESGVRFCAEVYGSDSPLNNFRDALHVDLDMDEFWTQFVRTGMPNVRRRASLPHLLGHSLYGAESFTNTPSGGMGMGWEQTPAKLKQVGDLAFASGINLMMLHSYVHQPRSDLRPGFTLGPAGTHFGRLDTWWSEAGGWVEYLSRCQYLLQQGGYKADLLRLGHDDIDEFVDLTYPGLPAGYDEDAISPALFLQTKAAHGRIGIPGGTTYAAVILPDVWVADIDVLKHLAAVEQAGIPVFGPAPIAPAGLRDMREHGDEWTALVRQLWREPAGSAGSGGRRLGSFLADHGIEPDLRVRVAGADTIRWVHRATPEAEIYFLSNQSTNPVRFTADFRVAGRQPELWDPISGTITPLPVYRRAGSRTELGLALAPAGSLFVLFRGAETPRHIEAIAEAGEPVHANGAVRFIGGAMETARAGTYDVRWSDGTSQRIDVPPLPAPITVAGPWRVDFRPPVGTSFSRDFPALRSWPELADDAIRYFSGTATYHATFNLAPGTLAPDTRVALDLGRVCDLAAVRVNGRPAGVAWTAPFTVDITDLVRAGNNDLEVAVTNAWANRLIGDEHLPDDVPWTGKGGNAVLKSFPSWYNDPARIHQRQRVTFATAHLYDANSPLVPAGLLGPVSVRCRRVVPLERGLR